MAMVSMVVGAVTDDGATFVAKVGTGPVSILVADNDAMTSPTTFGPVAVDADDVAQVQATGLDAGTNYWWQVVDNGVTDTSATGRFHTHPAVGSQASFTVALASCAGAGPAAPGDAGGELAPNRVSNHSVFDRIREADPLMFAHLGDLHYYDLGSGNHGITGGASLANYRAAYDDVLAQSRQHQMYREIPIWSTWDDHDFGPDNSDGTHIGSQAAQWAYRRRMPAYDLSDEQPGGLLLTGAAGDYASTPDTGALDITGDLDLRADVSMPQWATGSTWYAISKWTTTGSNRSYALRVDGAGDLQLAWSTTGASGGILSATATAALEPSEAGRLAIRATLDVSEAGDHIVTFYTAATIAGPWTQLGSPVIGAGATSIFSGTAALTVGGFNNGASSLNGGVWHGIEVRNGIDGTAVANPDFSGEDPDDTSFVDNAGRTWTVNGDGVIIGPYGPIYQSRQIGRVLFASADTRSRRTPNAATDDASKTMLGAAQKLWFDNLLATSDAELLVWLMPTPWLSEGSDSWGVFTTERDELVAMLDSRGWLNRMVMVYGDRHALGINSGGTNDWGSFPVAQFAALDSSPSTPLSTERFDVVPDTPGRDQWGTLSVDDLGTLIRVTLTGYRGDEILGSHTFSVPLQTAQPSAPEVMLRVLHGSHMATFDAQVLTTFQSGGVIAGTSVPIIDGDVRYDGSADIYATLELTVPGVDEDTGKPWFPRHPGDLLAPYGNEVWVRRGVDLGGGGVVWADLGVFRIESVEQDGDPESPIRISGSDRMAALAEAKVVEPREYGSTTPIITVFTDLVTDVYPDADVIFDDASGLAPVGRQVIVDEGRYAPLREIAVSIGKIIFWDGLGVLRVETAPDDDDVAWEVKAGKDGVLITARRRITRQGAFNAVIVTGEGGDVEEPVRGVAVDMGPTSPTRWGGRFGKVPLFRSSPLVSTASQATTAAREILRRNLGAPYSADFGSVVNPTLRPHQTVRVTQRDGTRERHVIETATVPLVTSAHQQATTRERTRVLIGSVITS